MDFQEQETPLEHNDDLQMEGDIGLKIHDAEVPKIGMEFQSEQQAYDFYNRYARGVGFSVRKGSTTHRKDKTISRRVLLCSNEGTYEKHSRGSPLKPRMHTRTSCEAKLVIKLQDDGKYYVVEFSEEHNHELANLSQVHMLRSQRKIETPQARLIEQMHSAGIRPKDIFSYMSTEAGGFENLNFIQMDCDNLIQRKKREDILKKGDAQLLLEYFQSMQKANPYFFYAIQVNEKGQLCNCFWCDAKCRMDYNFFGDAVCFDTTFGTNDYDKPFAPFVGVNNHGQSILFGCALLLDETTESFIWLFQTFLNAMNEKHPKTIFTDQAMPIMNAIKHVFPNTHHRLCLWHIFQLSLKHLSHVFENFKDFSKDFKCCIYENETEEEFQSMWQLMLQKYNLIENKWLQALYQKREKWAQVYGRDHFCAGLTTTQRSESMNSFLKKFLSRTLSLQAFITQYEKVLASRREKEKFEDFKDKQRQPNLRTQWPVEARASKKYTNKMFALFQEEYVHTLDLIVETIVEDGTICKYKVTSFRNALPRTVTFISSDNSVQCSCKKFEFMGMLCAHALKILHSKQLSDLPSQYYLNRWTKDAKIGIGAGVEEHEKSVQVSCGSSLTLRYSELAHIALTIAMKGTNTENSSTFTKRLLVGVLEELDTFLKSNVEETKSIEDLENANSDKVGETSVKEPLCANITLLQDPPRRKKKGRDTGRIKAPTEPRAKRNKKNRQVKETRQSLNLKDVDDDDMQFESLPRGLTPSSWTDEIPSSPICQINSVHPMGTSTMPLRPFYYPQTCTEESTMHVNETTSNHGQESSLPNQGFTRLLSQQLYPDAFF